MDISNKPTLRDETLSERLLKRQLRRFITITVEADKSSKVYLHRHSHNVYVESFNLYMFLNFHKMRAKRIPPARTKQAVMLRAVYSKILSVMKLYGKMKLDTVNWDALSNECKIVLYKTRRDMTLP